MNVDEKGEKERDKRKTKWKISSDTSVSWKSSTDEHETKHRHVGWTF